MVNSCLQSPTSNYLPVGGDDGDAEPARIGLGQFGNVIGDFAVVDRGEAGVEFAQHIAERGGGRFHFAQQQIEFAVVGCYGHRCDGSRMRSSDHALQLLTEGMIGKAIGEDLAAGQADHFRVQRQHAGHFGLIHRLNFFAQLRHVGAGGTLLTSSSILGTSSLRANSTVTAVP